VGFGRVGEGWEVGSGGWWGIVRGLVKAAMLCYGRTGEVDPLVSTSACLRSYDILCLVLPRDCGRFSSVTSLVSWGLSADGIPSCPSSLVLMRVSSSV